MIKRLLKAIPVALVAVFTLTSCALIENILGTILVNAAINLPILVNGVDIIPEGTDVAPELIEWTDMPVTANKRADLDYVKNILVIPSSLSTSVFGLNVKVKFETKLIGDGKITDIFKKLTLSSSELPDGLNLDLSSLPFPVDFAIDIYIPIGDHDLLDDVENFNDLENLMETKTKGDIIDATNQEERDVTLEISASSAKTTKKKNYYFKLTKPEFGEIVLDELFESGFLINVLSYESDGTTPVKNLEQLPTDENNPYLISYLTDTIVIPETFTVADVGDVVITSTVNVDDFFFTSLVTKPISEIAPDVDIIEGDISARTYTPLGSYYTKVPGSVVDAYDFADHIKDATSNQDQLRDLYQASQGEAQNFSVHVHVEAPGGSREETYYFRVEEAMLDEEIVDYAINSDFVLHKIHYKNTDEVKKVTDVGQTAADPLTLEYLTESIALPKIVTLDGFDTVDRDLTFTVNFDSPAHEELFYAASKLLEGDNAIDGATVTVQTLTPIGEDYDPIVDEDDLDGFAAEIEGLAKNDAETLYQTVSQDAFNEVIHLEVVASLPSKKAGEPATEKTRDFYVQLIPADIDQEVVDFLVGDNSLVNVVNYEDVKDGDYSHIESIANDATDAQNRYEVEHLTDTIVIPEEIILTKYDNKKLEITSQIFADGNQITFFDASVEDISIQDNEVVAKTITSPGSFDWQAAGVAQGDLEGFAQGVKDLPQRELYDATQAGRVDFEVHVEIKLYNVIDPAAAEPVYELGAEAVETKVFYFTTKNFTITNQKIGEAIANEFGGLVNVIKARDYNNGTIENYYQENPKTPQSKLTLKLFTDTIVFPKQITLQDFGEIALSFDTDFADDADYFFNSTLNTEYEGQLVAGTAITPVAHYDTDGLDNDYSKLFARFTNFMEVAQIININEDVTTELRDPIVIRVTIHVNGEETVTQAYYFNVERTTINDFPDL